MEKEREEIRAGKVMEKKKTLSTKMVNKVWKLCSFILNETINVFVPKRAIYGGDL